LGSVLSQAGKTDLGRTSWGRPHLGPTAGVLALSAVVVLLVLVPLVGLGLGAITNNQIGDPTVFSWEPLTDAYSDPTHYRSMFNSLVYSAVTATVLLVLGGILAWLAARTDSSIRRMIDLFVLIPVLIPSVLFVAGWILLLNPKSGMINQIAISYFGFSKPPFDIFSFPGMVWVGTLQELPLAFLWLYPAFGAMNPDLEDAGAIAGASKATILWVIFFLTSFGSLMVPILIGLPSRIVMYSTEIYLASNQTPSDLNLASALSMVFVLTAIIGVQVYRRATRHASRFVTVTGKAFNPRITKIGRWDWLAAAFGVALLLVSGVLPVFVLVWNAFMPYPQPPSIASIKLMTMANFHGALAYESAGRALANSLELGLSAGFITTLLGGLIAWSVLRLKRPRFALAMLDQGSTVPIAVPGLLVGVSLLWFYLIVPLPIYGTKWILLIAYITVHLPYATRICGAGLSQLHAELEEAGQICGARWLTVMRRIVLMLVAPSVLTSVIYVSLRSFREYAASLFLTAPGTEVFSVLVLNMWEGGNIGILCAYTTMVMLLLAVIVGCAQRLTRRSGIRSVAQ
jgi:iron(III) transport system permease protein